MKIDVSNWKTKRLQSDVMKTHQNEAIWFIKIIQNEVKQFKMFTK